MGEPGNSIVSRLEEMGFKRFGFILERDLTIEIMPPPEPAVYVAVLDGKVFWVGETGNARRRFGDYKRWLALPDNSQRGDVRARDKLLKMTGGEQLVLFYKKPMTIWSNLTSKEYSAHRVEEMILIDYFKPAWNTRPGGRRRG